VTTPFEHRSFCTGDHIGPLCSTEGLRVDEGTASIEFAVLQDVGDALPYLHVEFLAGWPALGTFGLLHVGTVMSMANAVELRAALAELIDRAAVQS
jgi:hypothetical protein